MGYSAFRRPKTTKSKYAEPHSWIDLDNLGLARSHWFDRFIEIGSKNCPRCGNDHLNITKIQQTKNSGWQWSCVCCGQIWRQPQIIPRHRTVNGGGKPTLKDNDQQEVVEYSENDHEIIRYYK